MDIEEFDNAPSQLKEIFIQYGLEARRKRYFEKTK